MLDSVQSGNVPLSSKYGLFGSFRQLGLAKWHEIRNIDLIICRMCGFAA